MDIQAARKTDTVPTLISQISRIKPLTEMKALLDAASDEDIAIGNLAQLIESVPVVAARVLAMAGSAYYGSIEAPRSVTDAIVRVLGMTQVRLLVVGFAANAAFKPEKCPGFDPERYWSSALLTAYLCRRLIAETKPRNSLSSNDIYLCGLLHNIGVIALAQVFPEKLNEAFKIAKANPDRSLSDIGMEVIGIDHCQAGAILADKWGLPRHVGIVSKHYHNSDYESEYEGIVTLVHFCSNWTDRLLSDQSDGLPDAETAASLGIGQKTLAEMAASCMGQVEAIIGLARMMTH